MTEIKKWPVWEYLVICVGCVMMAFAIECFFNTYSLVTGGVTGLAIVIGELAEKLGFPAPIWLTNIVLNVPLFLLGLKTKGKHFLARTLFATVTLSVALYFAKYIPPMQAGENELILISIFGGAISGFGLGLVFRCFATTGGTDLAASILHNYYKHISVSRLLFVMDSIVIVIGLFVFGPVRAMYAIVAVFISSKAIDVVLEGTSFAKAAFIISNRSEEIAAVLLSELSRGVTGLTGRGMYTRHEKNVLLCVVSVKEVVKVKELVHKLDESAFVIVADVREVLGEGFQSIA